MEGECNCVACREERFRKRFWKIVNQKHELPFIPRNLDASEDYGTTNGRRYSWRTRYHKLEGMLKELNSIHQYNYRRISNYKRYNSKFVYCADCGHAFKKEDGIKVNYTTHYPRDGQNYNNRIKKGWVCHDCAINYEYCTKCKFYHYANSFKIVCLDQEKQRHFNRYGGALNGDKMCIACYAERYETCDRCNISVLKTVGHWFVDTGMMSYNFHDRVLCDQCHESYKANCELCGGIYYTFQEQRSSEGKRICQTCFQKSVTIHEYAYKPKPIIRTGKKNPKISEDTLLFGVEAEVENLKSRKPDSTPRQAMAHRFLLEMGRDIWYIKTDSSLYDGIEIVSHPFSWQQWKEDKEKWLKMLALFKSYHYGGNKHTGIHIHMSKKAFTTLHLYKFIQFIYADANRDFMESIAQRTGSQINNYACYYEEDENNLPQVAKAKANVSGERHSAVSLHYSPTAEIRIFQGTIIPRDFFKNIEFCKALFEFSKDNKISDMVAYQFVRYFTNTPNQYRNLLEFVTKDEHINSKYPVIENVLKKGV